MNDVPEYQLHPVEDVIAIELTSGPFSGITFSFGKASFSEPDIAGDDAILSFEYDIIDDGGYSIAKGMFETYIGDLLQHLIVEGVRVNSIVYSGGIDSEID